MKKVIFRPEETASPAAGLDRWIGTEQIAEIAVTSEDPLMPIENVLDPASPTGWRASTPGEQQVRIAFRDPMLVERIELEFVEDKLERTQEFVIRWSGAADGERKDIIRQRWNFSPHGSTREHEDYRVHLEQVLLLELWINPDISRSDTFASLAYLRIG